MKATNPQDVCASIEGEIVANLLISMTNKVANHNGNYIIGYNKVGLAFLEKILWLPAVWNVYKLCLITFINARERFK